MIGLNVVMNVLIKRYKKFLLLYWNVPECWLCVMFNVLLCYAFLLCVHINKIIYL